MLTKNKKKMNCTTKNLYELYNTPNTGNVFWLGYNTIVEGPEATGGASNTICDSFPWTDPCTPVNVTNDITTAAPLALGYENTTTPTGGGLPVAIGDPIVNPASFNLDGLAAGYYGFLHVTSAGNGCCDFECVEIEVLTGPACMDDVQISFCIGSVPEPLELAEIVQLIGQGLGGSEIDDLGGCNDGNGNEAAFIANNPGVFSGPNSLGSINPTTGQITTVTQPSTPGTDVFTYTVAAPTSNTHPLEACCVDLVVDINISYIEGPDAGSAMSIAVCN